MAKRISPQVREFIDALGGGTAVADELNKMLSASDRQVDREAVYKWKEANNIPHYRRLVMASLGANKNLPLPAILKDYAPSRSA